MRRLFHRENPGLPDAWQEILAARSAQWRFLDDDERRRLGELADGVVRSKRWEAARGFEITDEVRTLIAGHAALLVLGLGDASVYDRVGTIVVRGKAMTRTAPMAGPAPGLLVDSPGAVDGEAHDGNGPIMMVWSSVRREAANPRWGRDVVLHEFAHKLDMLDGSLDGTPPLDAELRERWVTVCTAEFYGVRDGVDGWLRPYAGTNPSEFFAVATEAFFTRPVAMTQDKPELYDVLSRYYRQDPATRIRAALARQQGG